MNGRFINFTTKNGLPSNDIRSLYDDAPESLWIGTNGAGLVHLTPAGTTIYTTANGLSDNHVWSIFEDSGGSLWLGTGEGGLNRLHNREFSRFTRKEGFSGEEVWAIAEDLRAAFGLAALAADLIAYEMVRSRPLECRRACQATPFWGCIRIAKASSDRNGRWRCGSA